MKNLISKKIDSIKEYLDRGNKLELIRNVKNIIEDRRFTYIASTQLRKFKSVLTFGEKSCKFLVKYDIRDIIGLHYILEEDNLTVEDKEGLVEILKGACDFLDRDDKQVLLPSYIIETIEDYLMKYRAAIFNLACSIKGVEVLCNYEGNYVVDYNGEKCKMIFSMFHKNNVFEFKVIL